MLKKRTIPVAYRLLLLGLVILCTSCAARQLTPTVSGQKQAPTSVLEIATIPSKTGDETQAVTIAPPSPESQPEASTKEESADNLQKIPAASPTPIQPTSQQPQFDRFVDQVKNGNPKQIVGVFIENVLALRVIQQPPNNSNYVSNVKGVTTQFLLAYQISGNIGLLAHNYLSGNLFFKITPGDIAQIIYGDGNVEEYEVTEYHEYQALIPDSPNSDFVDLDTGEKLSAGDLFNQVYSGSQRLIFQTCIAQDNIDTWGRLFVISFPY